MALTNDFGWSISRESMFDSCPRRYYFHYYLSWGGWERSAPLIAREAFRLKRLTSLPLWRGQLVHYVASKVLASLRTRGRIPPLEDVSAYIMERFDTQLAFSEERRYLREPKKSRGRLNIDWLALFEHEYGIGIEPERIERARGECVEAMENLIGSGILSRIARTDTSGWAIEDIDLGQFSQVFDFEGARVFAKTDFMFRGDDGTFNIVDWKTFSGESSAGKARVQLGVYGYYAASVLGEPLETIRLHEVNLLADGAAVTEYEIGEADLDEFRGRIRAGIEKLSSVLVGADIGRNEALPPESFPGNESGGCRRCNFYRICIDEESACRLP